jgi:hypothetical protein
MAKDPGGGSSQQIPTVQVVITLLVAADMEPIPLNLPVRAPHLTWSFVLAGEGSNLQPPDPKAHARCPARPDASG